MTDHNTDLLGLVRAMFRQELQESLIDAMREALPRLLDEFDNDDGELMSVPSAAKYLDVTPKTIYRRIRDGRIQSVGKGALTRVRKRDLVRVLDDQAAEIIDIEALAKRMVAED